MGMLVDSVFAKAVTQDSDGFFATAGNEIYNGALLLVKTSGDALLAVTNRLFEVDAGAAFVLLTYFSITYPPSILLVIILLLVVYLVYKMALLEPVGGKGSGFKYSMLVLALIGYSLPLLNLFPWVGLWILAIVKNPK